MNSTELEVVNHLLDGYLKRGLVGVIDARIRDDDVEAACHTLDLLDGCLVILPVRGDDFKDMDAVRVRLDERVQVRRTGRITSSGEDDSVRATG